LIILDVMKDHRIRFIRKIAEKMGITEFLEISVETVNRR
jgi:FMN-dependent NADH-azoreductase